MRLFSRLRPSPAPALLLLALSTAACGRGDTRPATPDDGGEPQALGVGVVNPAREGDPLAEMDAYIAERRISKSSPVWRLRLPPPAQVGFPKDKHVHWVLETNRGRMLIKLWHEVAPLHVSNTIYLTRLGFYDGLTFHRVIQGFMAQGGCPVGNGTGMPGYGLPLEVRREARHDRAGLLSTAHTAAPNTDGSQFFLTFRPTPELDLGYTVYGEIVEGLETLRLLEAAGAAPGGGSSAPRQPLLIQRATIELR